MQVKHCEVKIKHLIVVLIYLKWSEWLPFADYYAKDLFGLQVEQEALREVVRYGVINYYN